MGEYNQGKILQKDDGSVGNTVYNYFRPIPIGNTDFGVGISLEHKAVTLNFYRGEFRTTYPWIMNCALYRLRHYILAVF